MMEDKIYKNVFEVVKAINEYTEENHIYSIRCKQIEVENGYKIKIIEETKEN